MILGEEARIELSLYAQNYMAGLAKVEGETKNSGKTIEDVYRRMDKSLKASEDQYIALGNEAKANAQQQRILEASIKALLRNGVDPADNSIKTLRDRMVQLEDSTKKTATTNQTIGQSFAAMRDVMQGPIAGAKMVIDGLGKVAAVAGELYDAWGEAEQAGLIFNQAIKDSGIISDAGGNRLKAYADEIQRTTIFEGDATLAIMANLAAMGKSEEQIQDLIKAAAGYASATGIDMDQAVKQLNGTLQGNATMLARQNAEIKALTPEQLKNGDAIAIITKQYAGMAEAVAGGAAGGKISLANAFGDLKEEIGALISEQVGPATSMLTEFFRVVANGMADARNLKNALEGGADVDYAKAIEQQKKLVEEIKAQDEANIKVGRVITGRLETEQRILETLKRQRDAQAARDRDRQQSLGVAAEQARKEAEKAQKAADELAKTNAGKRDKLPMLGIAQQWQAEMRQLEGSPVLIFEKIADAASEARQKIAEEKIAAMETYVNEESEIVQKAREVELKGNVEAARAWYERMRGLNDYGISYQAITDAHIAGDEKILEANVALARIEYERMRGLDDQRINYQAITDARIAGEKALQDALDETARKQEENINKTMAQYKTMAGAFGAAIVSGEEGWKAFGRAGLNAIANIVDAMAIQADAAIAAGMAQALSFGEFWKIPGIGAAVAQSLAIHAGAGAIRAIPMANGGDVMVNKPTLFLAGEAGPERATFTPQSRGGFNTAPNITINVGGSILTERDLKRTIVSAVAQSGRGF